MHPALCFEGVGKTLAGRAVLREVSFGVAPGEAVGLVGLNGAGKTTLLRALLDLAPPDAGRIEIFGLPARSPAARAALAYLPERFTPPGFATGREILAHLLALHGLALDPAAAAPEAEALELDPAVLARPAGEYSKGMAQKLGLVACVLARRALLVLDEPTSGLDLHARQLFHRRLAALRDEGAALFFSSHAVEDLEVLDARLVVLHEGTVRFTGSAAALRERYGQTSADTSTRASLLACLGVK